MSKTKTVKETKMWNATWDSSVNRFRVRRLIYFRDGTRKLENKPHLEYGTFDKDAEKIQEYIERENYRKKQKELARREYNIRTSFIKGNDYNEEFGNWMLDRTSNEVYSKNVASSVRQYLIGYHHTKLQNYDYKTWISIESQSIFVKFLKGKNLAHKTIMTIKNNSNMFFQFLHEKSKGEIELMRFSFPSLTRSGTRRYEKVRKAKARNTDKSLSGEDYINVKDFKKIYNFCLRTTKNGDEKRYRSLLPMIWLSYHYRLRRSESMAVDAGCLRGDYLEITKRVSSALIG